MFSCDKCWGSKSLDVPFHIHWNVVALLVALLVGIVLSCWLVVMIGRWIAYEVKKGNWKVSASELLLSAVSVPLILFGFLLFLPFCVVGFCIDGRSRRDLASKLGEIWRDRFALWNK